jgi:hypothetical protein
MRISAALLACLLGACHERALGPDGTRPCADLTDRASCEADPSCVVAACPTCPGQDPGFVACYDNGAPPPQFGCPNGCGVVTPVDDCASLTTQADCDAMSGCYSVLTFAHPEPCDSSGCEVGFDHCASGAPPCSISAVCEEAVQPCPPPYTNVYDGAGCVAGCVEGSVCPPDGA